MPDWGVAASLKAVNFQTMESMPAEAGGRYRHDITKRFDKRLTDELLPGCEVQIPIPAIALRVSVGRPGLTDGEACPE